jgi:hypothetical protein
MKGGFGQGEPGRQGEKYGHRPELESLLGFDSKIRCVVEVGSNGERIAFLRQKGLESLEPEGETTRVLDQVAIGAGMGASMNGYHGRVRVIIVARERLSIILFPLFDSLVLVSADPDFPLEKTRQMAMLFDTPLDGESKVEGGCVPDGSYPTFRELRGNML